MRMLAFPSRDESSGGLGTECLTSIFTDPLLPFNAMVLNVAQGRQSPFVTHFLSRPIVPYAELTCLQISHKWPHVLG